MPRKLLRPPIKLRRKMAPLIEACRNLILTAPSQTSGSGLGDKAVTIILKFGLDGQGKIAYPAEGFPSGVTVERRDEWVAVKYDVKRVLAWLKERAYTSYDASDLFSMRLPVLMRLAKLELGLDRLLEGVDMEQQHTKDIDSDE